MAVSGNLSASDQASTEAQYRSYPLTHASSADVEQMLADLLRDVDSTAHIVVDSRKNQLLVRGSETVQRIARRLVESVDRPPVATPAAATPAVEEPVLKPYECPRGQLESIADRLRSLYGERSGVRVAALTDRSQLLVLALPETHDIIARQLRSWETADRYKTPRAALATQTTAEAPQQPAQSAQSQTADQFVRIVHTTIDRIESMLRTLLGKRLTAGARIEPDYRFVNAAGREVHLTIDRRRHGFAVSGDRKLVGQFGRLLSTLDSRPETGDRKVRVVPVLRADPAKIKQAVDAYRSNRRPDPSHAPEGPPRNPVDPDQGQGPSAVLPLDAQSRLDRPDGIRQVAFQQDAADAQPPNDGQPLDVRELGGDVEMETLPDLDVIILRGRDGDVEEITRIIEEIERLSVETEPAIEIYYLEHVRGESLETIINEISQDLIGGRQGRVSITPLVKPNALLLIGWGEAVKAVKELIRKLDQPVQPTTQFRVFRLQHAPATTVQTTVQQFFTGRTGLGPRVQVTADARTNSLVVEAAPRDMSEVETLVKQLDTGHADAVNQARVFRLKNSLATDVSQILTTAIAAAAGGTGAQKSAVLELLTVDAEGERILKSGILSEVQITPDPRTNTLLISAPEESMDLLEALVRQLDERPSETSQIKVFRVTNGDATNLVRVLQSLLPGQTGGTSVPQLPSAEGETSLVPVRFAVDIRTNSIVATGAIGDLEIIEALLLRLDEEGFLDRENTVYRLRNAPALDVARAITEYLQRERDVERAAPGAESPFEQIESVVVVVPEPVSNALILSATPKYFEKIMKLVEELDAPPPQVMIQVLIAEVTLDDTDEFGVEFGFQDSILFNRSLLDNIEKLSQTVSNPGQPQVTSETIISQEGVPGFNFNSTQPLGNNVGKSREGLAGQGLSNFALGRMNSELGFGGLVLSASNESISVLIRALQESGRLEILSRPQVLTLDNQPAFIQVGQRVPRIIGTTVNQTGQVNTVQLENVGLILGVTPRISPDGTVVMDIDAEKSDLGPESDGIPVSISSTGEVIRSPRVNIATAQTTVSAADGQTIVLGGMITKSKSELTRRVPYLADVPVLGHMFRYDSTINLRAELIIIMTPRIVQDAEDHERLKYVESARMHWCAGDVHELHGDPSFCHSGGCPICDGQIPVIYPDVDPSGMQPDRMDADDIQLPPLPRNGQSPLAPVPPADLSGHTKAYPQPVIPNRTTDRAVDTETVQRVGHETDSESPKSRLRFPALKLPWRADKKAKIAPSATRRNNSNAVQAPRQPTEDAYVPPAADARLRRFSEEDRTSQSPPWESDTATDELDDLLRSRKR